MSHIKHILCGLILIAFAGCSTATKESTEQPPPVSQESATQAEPAQPASEETQQAAAPAPSRSTTPAREPSRAARRAQAPQDVQKPVAERHEPEAVLPARQALEEPAALKAPEPRYATIPSGTSIQVRLQDPLDSAVNESGDTFRAIVDKDIEVNGNVVAPRGSIVEGKLTNVKRSGRVEGRASMSLQLVDLKIDQQSYPLQTEVLAFEAESSKKSDATKVGIGAGLGAVIGAIAGGGKGAAIGAAVGGGAGGATVLATRGKEVKFDAEQKFSFILNKDISVNLK
jgi:hypothetical protein